MTGLYALATATELAYGYDPAVCVWDNNNKHMREHLFSCFENGVITRFPITEKRKLQFGRRVRWTSVAEIYCKCRMVNEEDKAMILCNVCKEWFHFECLHLDPNKSYSEVKWLCPDCDKLFVMNS